MASASAPTKEECVAAGEAAQEVVRTFFVQLCNAVTTGDVLAGMYANHLIDQRTFELYVESGTGLVTSDKTRQVVLKVQRSVSCGYDKTTGGNQISKLCKILSGEGDPDLTKLAKAIEDSYECEWELKKAAIKVQMAERSKIDDLRKQLEAFNMTRHMQLPELPDIAVITERIIQHHIEQSINAAVEITTIRDQLRELNDDSIISSQLYTWALKEVDKFAVTESVMPATNPYINVEPVKNIILGDSPHGRVQLVVDKDGVKYAAKRFIRGQCKEFTSEFALLARIRHKNIVRYIGLAQFRPSETPAVVMELMDIDLHKRIMLTSKPPIEYGSKIGILQGIADGLHYLHSHHPMIIHRDLTAKNILLNSSGVAKIADFGNSRLVDQEQLMMMTSLTGTLVYLAPEAQGKAYNEKIDIFSYGHLMLFIFIEEFPCHLLSPSYYEVDPEKGANDQVPKVRLETERREEYITKLAQKLRDTPALTELVKKCLSNKPEERPTALQLVEHYKHEDNTLNKFEYSIIV